MTHAQRPRVTVLTQVLGGGTGMQIRGIYGHESLAGWKREAVILGEATEPVPDGATVERLPAIEALGPYPLGHLRAFAALRRHLSSSPPDVLHTYFFWPILFGRILKALGVVKRLVENREDEGFNWGRHEYAWLQMTRRLPDRIVCVSHGVRDHVLRNEGQDADRLRVIHNGVAEPREVGAAELAATRDEVGLDADRPVVGMVANLNRPVKGADYFVQTAAKILREEPTTQFLLVGGSGDPAHMLRRLEELGISDAMHFAGFRVDVAPFYALMDISILTSLSEGLSITLLESMSRGLPVVATRVGGNPEVVADGDTGYLVPPRDPAAMSGRIVELLRDRELRMHMGRRARERYLEEFSLDRTARDYAELLGTLV